MAKTIQNPSPPLIRDPIDDTLPMRFYETAEGHGARLDGLNMDSYPFVDRNTEQMVEVRLSGQWGRYIEMDVNPIPRSVERFKESLSETGYFRNPDIKFDRVTGYSWIDPQSDADLEDLNPFLLSNFSANEYEKILKERFKKRGINLSYIIDQSTYSFSNNFTSLRDYLLLLSEADKNTRENITEALRLYFGIRFFDEIIPSLEERIKEIKELVGQEEKKWPKRSIELMIDDYGRELSASFFLHYGFILLASGAKLLPEEEEAFQKVLQLFMENFYLDEPTRETHKNKVVYNKNRFNLKEWLHLSDALDYLIKRGIIRLPQNEEGEVVKEVEFSEEEALTVKGNERDSPSILSDEAYSEPTVWKTVSDLLGRELHFPLDKQTATFLYKVFKRHGGRKTILQAPELAAQIVDILGSIAQYHSGLLYDSEFWQGFVEPSLTTNSENRIIYPYRIYVAYAKAYLQAPSSVRTEELRLDEMWNKYVNSKAVTTRNPLQGKEEIVGYIPRYNPDLEPNQFRAQYYGYSGRGELPIFVDDEFWSIARVLNGEVFVRTEHIYPSDLFPVSVPVASIPLLYELAYAVKWDRDEQVYQVMADINEEILIPLGYLAIIQKLKPHQWAVIPTKIVSQEDLFNKNRLDTGEFDSFRGLDELGEESGAQTYYLSIAFNEFSYNHQLIKEQMGIDEKWIIDLVSHVEPHFYRQHQKDHKEGEGCAFGPKVIVDRARRRADLVVSVKEAIDQGTRYHPMAGLLDAARLGSPLFETFLVEATAHEQAHLIEGEDLPANDEVYATLMGIAHSPDPYASLFMHATNFVWQDEEGKARLKSVVSAKEEFLGYTIDQAHGRGDAYFFLKVGQELGLIDKGEGWYEVYMDENPARFTQVIQQINQTLVLWGPHTIRAKALQYAEEYLG